MNTKNLFVKNGALSKSQFSYECYGLRGEGDYSHWEKLNTPPQVGYYYSHSLDSNEIRESKVILTVQKSALPVVPSKLHCAILRFKTKSGFGNCRITGKGEFYFSETKLIEVDVTEDFKQSGKATIEIIPYSNMRYELVFDAEIPVELDLLYESDAEPAVSSVAVQTPPKKTVYAAGSLFDCAGTKLKVTYVDGGWRYVEKGMSGSSSPLSLGNTQAAVTYGGKSVNVPITVKSAYDTIDEKNNGRGVYFDNPKIDLKTGNLFFVAPDMTVGQNSYEIGVSHVYCSNADDMHSRVFTACGKGWKLNLEQYVLKSPNGNNYKLIDDLGYVHVFEKFDDKRYFDTADAGTVLEEETDGVLITDAKGNKIKFNTSGKIAYTQAALNPEIKKIFEYNGSKLMRVYDSRCKKGGTVQKSIEFTYKRPLDCGKTHRVCR